MSHSQMLIQSENIKMARIKVELMYDYFEPGPEACDVSTAYIS